MFYFFFFVDEVGGFKYIRTNLLSAVNRVIEFILYCQCDRARVNKVNLNLKRGANLGTFLHNICIWQETHRGFLDLHYRIVDIFLVCRQQFVHYLPVHRSKEISSTYLNSHSVNKYHRSIHLYLFIYSLIFFYLITEKSVVLIRVKDAPTKLDNEPYSFILHIIRIFGLFCILIKHF